MKQPDLYYYEAIKSHYKLSQILYGENELQASPGGALHWVTRRGPVGVKSTHFFSQWQIPQMVVKYTLKPLMVANEKNQTCIAISWMILKLHYIVKYLWLCFIA